jgi:prepilin-type N-terminal cleavage/methylation domain-containing protein
VRGRSAFTLIELLVVVAIISILSMIAVPNFLEAQTRSKVSAVKANMRTMATVIEVFAVDHTAYPPAYENWGLVGRASDHGHRISYETTPLIFDNPGWSWRKPAEYPLFPQARYDLFNDASIMRNDQGDDPTDPGYPGWKMGKLVYFEHQKMLELALGCDWDDCDPDNWLVAYELAGEWSLHSVGPARHFQTPRWLDLSVIACLAPGCTEGIYRQDIWPYNERSMFRDYDPTNGTISAGHIWRTQKNPALLGTHVRFYDENSAAI